MLRHQQPALTYPSTFGSTALTMGSDMTPQAIVRGRSQRQAAQDFNNKVLPRATKDLTASGSPSKKKMPRGTEHFTQGANLGGFHCFRLRFHSVVSLDAVLCYTSEHQSKPRSLPIRTMVFNLNCEQYAAVVNGNKRCREKAPAVSGSSESARTGVHGATPSMDNMQTDDGTSVQQRPHMDPVSWVELLLELKELELKRLKDMEPAGTTGAQSDF